MNEQPQETAIENGHADRLRSEIAPPLFSNTSADQARQLQIWLDLPTPQERRRFLEVHCELLNERSEALLHDLCAQEPADVEQAKRRRETLLVLQDARKRGGTVEAVREASINLHGGFVLDLPPWLEEVEQRLTALLQEKNREQTAEERVTLLQEALEKSQEDVSLVSELLITLQRELADAWRKHPRTDRAQALEMAISLYKEVLRFYTTEHYPYQYAKVQAALGNAYRDRIVGERRENLERAIICYQETLRLYTLNDFPFEYGLVQNDLGITYWYRIAGERKENLEQAIICYQEVLCAWTFDAFPFYYAATQNNLALTYQNRIVGERKENVEQAITCYQEALRVHTLDGFPFDHALTLNNLGLAYGERVVGERCENLERAIVCYREALRVWTLGAFPFYYAEAQNNLGNTYIQRIAGEHQENLEQAIVCSQEALRVYTLDAFPLESRNVYLSLAETEAQREDWPAVHDAYTAALEAEDLLVILGAGTLGRDAILKEGRDAASRLGYTLHRLGRIDEAAVAIERGRARGLAEAMDLDAADPALITDEARRSRYTNARSALITAQADLHTPLSQEIDEDTRRRLDLERTTIYRQTKAAFDAQVRAIRAAHDPDDFLHLSLDTTTLLHAATQIGRGHVLVYLVATPWGGVAVAAFGEQDSSSAHLAALALPDLTEAFVNTLVETRLDEQLLGGFALAQRGEGFAQLCQQWEGETFLAKIHELQAACLTLQQPSTLVAAAQAAMACSPFAALTNQALASLDREDYTLLQSTFDTFFLQRELTHCLEQLSTIVLTPMMAWLQKQGVTSLTLLPCGQLATFPLTAVVLPDGRSVGETLPTSVAPSVRSLLQTASVRSPQAGIATLGDPLNNLEWSEAEALALATLARRATLPVEMHLKHRATRERLLAALDRCWMVSACCHGLFDAQNFLQSALLLAHNERVTMAEMLNHSADVRGLRLLLLSACQTAQLDLQGAHNEVHSIAAAMLQAGAQAVIAAQWAVDDKATYLLMVRFLQEWLPHREDEPPAAALARAQAWLRHVTNQELARWQSTLPTLSTLPATTRSSEQCTTHSWQRLAVRGRSARWKDDEAQFIVRYGAQREEPSTQPYADPYYWAGFQVLGW